MWDTNTEKSKMTNNSSREKLASDQIYDEIYSEKKTTSSFRNLIILENFYGINRSFLLESLNEKIICNIIFFVVIGAIVGGSVYDFYWYASDMNISIVVFEAFIAFELIYLVAFTFERKSFKSLKRLDVKCGVDPQHLRHLRKTVNKTVVVAIASTVIDVIGGVILMAKKSVILTFCIAMAAQEAELEFYSILFEGINLRLLKVQTQPINFAWKMYRHILITALNLSEEFTARILMILTSSLINTVVYSVILLVIDPNSNLVFKLVVVMGWRVLKNLYSIWVLCRTAVRTKCICNGLVFALVGRLVLYSKDSHSVLHQKTDQLISCIRSQQPRYLSGTVMTLNLCLPLDLIDLSVNYLLIIVQIYMAFKNV